MPDGCSETKRLEFSLECRPESLGPLGSSSCRWILRCLQGFSVSNLLVRKLTSPNLSLCTLHTFKLFIFFIHPSRHFPVPPLVPLIGPYSLLLRLCINCLYFFPMCLLDSLVCYVKTSTINWINNIILTDMN